MQARSCYYYNVMEEADAQSSQILPPTSRLSRAWWVLGGLLVFALVCAALVWAFIRTPTGTALMTRYFGPPPVWPSAAAATSTPAERVLVPKALATEDYYAALNGAVSDYNLFGTLNNEQLNPLLKALQTNASSGDPSVSAHITEAQSLVGQEESLLDQFSSALAELSTANAGLSDIKTKSLTQAFIAEGTTTAAVAQQYDTLVSQALAMGSADTYTVSEIYAQSSLLALDSSQLQEAIAALTAYFSESVASTSPAQ